MTCPICGRLHLVSAVCDAERALLFQSPRMSNFGDGWVGQHPSWRQEQIGVGVTRCPSDPDNRR